MPSGLLVATGAASKRACVRFLSVESGRRVRMGFFGIVQDSM